MLRRTKIIVSVVGVLIAILLLTILLVLVRRPASVFETSSVSRVAASQQTNRHIGTLVGKVLGGADPVTCREAGAREYVDRCLFAVATSAGDRELCDEVKNAATQTRCHDILISEAVSAGADPEDCFMVIDPVAKEECVARAADAGAGEIFCRGLTGELQTICMDRVRFVQGIEYDKDVCDLIISDDLRGECFSVAGRFEDVIIESPSLPLKGLTDTDGDGLSDEDEEELGTDPLRADTDNDGLTDEEEVVTYRTDPLRVDTDGDGFSDGVEVENGFNPNGPGRL
jgi:hypothetical protein